MNKASFFQRLAAWSIDWAKPPLCLTAGFRQRERVILFIIYSLATIAVGLVSGAYTASRISVPNSLLSLGVSVFTIVLMLGDFLYFGYFWSRREQFSEGEASLRDAFLRNASRTRTPTIGMGMMSIKVVKTDDPIFSDGWATRLVWVLREWSNFWVRLSLVFCG